MDQYRKGAGFVKTIKASAPSQRTDGTPLDQNLITGYLFDMSFAGGLQVENMPVQLVNGEMTEAIHIDDYPQGVYKIRYQTTTVGFPSGGPESAWYEMEILPPLAPPNPPIILG